MNLMAIAAAALDRAPASVKGPVTFRDKSGNETTAAEAVGVPAKPTMADGFEAATAIRDRGRRLTVIPAGLTFLPLAGMIATWEGKPWNVVGVNPLNPSGATIDATTLEGVALIRVVLTR